MSLNGDALSFVVIFSITCEEDSTDRLGKPCAVGSTMTTVGCGRPVRAIEVPIVTPTLDIYLTEIRITSFGGGDQGFNMLAEEAVQYINSLTPAMPFMIKAVMPCARRI